MRVRPEQPGDTSHDGERHKHDGDVLDRHFGGAERDEARHRHGLPQRLAPIDFQNGVLERDADPHGGDQNVGLEDLDRMAQQLAHDGGIEQGTRGGARQHRADKAQRSRQAQCRDGRIGGIATKGQQGAMGHS